MTGARIYLLGLALLYSGLAAWCTLAPETTALALGYEFTGPSGRCEYLVVYGGLELGLALFFVLGAWRQSAELSALWLSLLLHGSLVLYRAAVIALSGELSPMIYGVFTLEILLTIIAARIALPRGLPQ